MEKKIKRMNFSWDKIVINSLILATLVLLLLRGIHSYHESQTLIESNAWLSHTHQVIEQANRLQLSFNDAGMEIYKYAFSGDERYKNAFAVSVKENSTSLAQLLKLTKDNPLQQQRLTTLSKLINSTFTSEKDMFNAPVKKTAPITSLLNDSAFQRNSDKSMALMNDIIAEELMLLQGRSGRLQYGIINNNNTMVSSIFLSDILIVLAMIMVFHQFKQRNQAELRQRKSENELIDSNKRLAESEERYNLAVTASHIGLWDWELGTNRMFYSTYVKRMLGYNEDEISNTVESFMKAIHPDDFSRVDKAIHDHLKNQVPYDIEYRLRLKNGVYHWFHVLGQAHQHHDVYSNHMVGSLVDINDRKEAELRLYIQYQIANLLAEGSTLEEVAPKMMALISESLHWDFSAMWLRNPQTNSLYCFETWQKDAERTATFNAITKKMQFNHGIGLPGRVLASESPLWIDDVLLDSNFPRLKYAIASKIHSAFCFPILLKSDVLGVIEFQSCEFKARDEEFIRLMAVTGIQLGLFVQRKLAENKLRESEAYKTAILESASDVILTLLHDGTIISYNQQTTLLLGCDASDLYGKNIENYIPGLMRELAADEVKSSREFIANRMHGQPFPIEITFSKMRVENEDRYVIMGRDITERKKVETMKNEFVSVVSHELRTPLTSIRGSLGLILGGKVGDFSQKAQKLLDIANKNCERLLLLINDILDIEKIEAGKMQFNLKKMDITQIVDDAIQSNLLYGKKYDVTLHRNDTNTTIIVNTDPDRLMQVLVNLLSNAIKFSPKGGEVEVSVEPMADNVRVSVTDVGSGIPLEFQTKIFQKFSQADSSTTRGKGGTGLGLNISKTIIEKMGGTIYFFSTPGKGTTFYVDYPIADLKNVKVENPALSVLNNNKRLLICEDDEDQALYLRTLLESTGTTVDIAPTVAKARELLSHQTYSALLLDLILPDQDGISFIRALRNSAATKDLPIIVLSIIAQTGQSLLNGEAISVIDWLDKPVDFEKLKKAISRIVPTEDRRPSILYVEDNHDSQHIVTNILKDKLNVKVASSLQTAKIMLKNDKFDLVLLDLHLPDGNGSELLPWLVTNQLPVIVYSNYELDSEYANYVSQTLLKFETTDDRLLKTINTMLSTVASEEVYEK